MIHEYRTRVFYADTDAYGVAWHGTYIRWMEQARTAFCDENGYDLKEFEEKGFVLPVVNLNLKYKLSAKLHDELVIETKVKELKRFAIIFEQLIKNAKTGKVCVEATIEVVAYDNNAGKLCRTMPLEGMERFMD